MLVVEIEAAKKTHDRIAAAVPNKDAGINTSRTLVSAPER